MSDETSVSNIDINSKNSIRSSIYLGVVGPALFIVQPAFVQGLVEYLGYDEQQAGYVASIEMWGIALTTVLLAFLANRISWHKILYIGVSFAVIGNLISAFCESAWLFLVLRFITGLGSGALISLSFTALGLTAKPERNYGLLIVGVLSYGAAGFLIFPTVLEYVGMTGLLIIFALFNVSALPFVRHLPQSGDEHAQIDEKAIELSYRYKALAVLTLFIYFTAQGVVWAYLFLIGTDAGVSEGGVTAGLTISQFTGVAGAFIAAVVADRFGRIAPLILGTMCSVVSLGILLGQVNVVVYGLAVCLFNLAWNQTHPYLLAALASFDRTGKLVVYGVAAQFIGIAFGPGLAAIIIGEASFSVIILLGIVLFLLSLVTMLPALVKEKRELDKVG